MKKIMEFKWQIVALGCLLFVIISARGGAQVLMPLVRWVVPLVVVIFILGFLKKKVLGGGLADAFRKQMEQAMQAQQQKAGGAAAAGQKTIDLCPKCGSYSGPGHKCKPPKA